MMAFWALLRPIALPACLALGVVLAVWRWAKASERMREVEAQLRLVEAERARERDAHAAEMGRLEDLHRAEIERMRRAAYRVAARRETSTLAEPPTEDGAAASEERRASYRALLELDGVPDDR